MESMEVDAFLADSVVVADNKLYVQGAGWDTVLGAAFPFRHSRMGIGVILRVPWTATNQMHTFPIKIMDPDGHAIPLGDAPPGAELPGGKVYNLQGQFNVGRPPLLTAGDSQVVPVAVNLDGLVFTEPTTYSVIVEVDGKEMRRLPVRVRSTVQMPGQLRPPLPGA